MGSGLSLRGGSKRIRMIAQEALKRMRDQFAKRAEHYRTANADPHGINTALSVAMLE